MGGNWKGGTSMNENEAISDEKHEAGSGFLVFGFASRYSHMC